MASRWEVTPRESVEAECARRGREAVVAGCRALLAGRPADPALVLALGGPPAPRVLEAGPDPHQDYWLRVWAARGLLHAWDEAALPELLLALADPAWRVRENAARVVARHLVGAALPAVDALRDDPVPRVSAAAARALVRLTTVGA